jgi:acyl-coenzyme A thioesterase PaaI-like protein
MDGKIAALEAQGWTRVPLDSYSATIDPVFMRGQAETREVALVTSAALANNRPDTVHGGAMMTFADIALGIGAVDAIGAPHCATVQLNYHFVRGVRVGQLVICRPQLVRRTSRLVFVRGLFEADGETAGSADGIFQSFAGSNVRAD